MRQDLRVLLTLWFQSTTLQWAVSAVVVQCLTAETLARLDDRLRDVVEQFRERHGGK